MLLGRAGEVDAAQSPGQGKMERKAAELHLRWLAVLCIASATGCSVMTVVGGNPSRRIDKAYYQSRRCIPKNHCELVEGLPRCEPGYRWADPDDVANNRRCVRGR